MAVAAPAVLGGGGAERLFHLCFDPAEFRDEESFTPAAFVVEKRRHVPIETLRRDLETYREYLQDQVVHLVNTDVYDTFLSVMNKLRSREADLKRLQAPLPEMAQRVAAACGKLKQHKASVGEKLQELTDLEQERRYKAQKLRLRVSEHRLRKLLLPFRPDRDAGKNPLQQRAASRAAQLDVLKSIAEEIRQQEFDERLWVAAGEEQRAERHAVSARLSQLRGAAVDVLQAEGKACMRQHQQLLTARHRSREAGEDGPQDAELRDAAECVRLCMAAFGTVEMEAEAAKLFRREVCDPAAEEVLSYRAAQQARASADAVRKLFSKLVEMWETRLRPVCDIVEGQSLVTAVWQSVADTVGKRMLFLFENGNPLLFHQRYAAAHEFVAALERGCSPDALLELRSSTEMVVWNSRWNLEVYYKMREITLAKQMAEWFPPQERWTGPCAIRAVGEVRPPVVAEADAVRFVPSNFALVPAAALHSALTWCVSGGVFLRPLAHRFLRLCLFAALGFQKWLAAALESHNLPVLDAGGDLVRGSSTPPPVRGDGGVGAAELVRLHGDVAQLRTLLRDDFASRIEQQVGAAARDAVARVIETCLAAAAAAAQEVSLCLTSVVAQQCIEGKGFAGSEPTNLEGMQNKIMHRFRMKRHRPEGPGDWVGTLLEPLRAFKEQARGVSSCPSEVVTGWTAEVVTMVCARYRTVARDMLVQAARTEAKKDGVRRVRGGETKAAVPETERPPLAEMQACDKMVLQVFLDVKEFGVQISQVGVSAADFPPYKRLVDSVVRGAWLHGEPGIDGVPPPIAADD